MITSTGQSIIAKYMVDQAPAYASYIAIGCGARPRTAYSDSITSYTISSNTANVSATGHPFLVGDLVTISSNVSTINGTYTVTAKTTDYFEFSKTRSNEGPISLSGTAILNFKNKETLDFEMFRVPITSRTFEQNVTSGTTTVILSGDLPSQERYYITEAGVFSAGSNPIAAGIDSRSITTFTTSENWESHNKTAAVSISSPITTIYSTSTGVIDTAVTQTVFSIENTNAVFEDTNRSSLLERPRMLQSSIAVSTGLSRINTSSTVWTATEEPHIHLIGKAFSFDKNASSDELKLAFSLFSVDPSASVPTNMYMMLEFSSDETETAGVSSDYAKAQFSVSSSDFIGGNRYLVKTLSLGALKKSSGFNWSAADIVKVYVSVPTSNLTVNTVAVTNNIATITTTATPKIIPGQIFTTSGLTNSVLNGTFEATAVNTSSNTISFAITTSNITSTSDSGSVFSSDGSYYVILDGLRFENNRDRENNPIYGMVSYSPVQTSTNQPALKEVNSANIFEAKFNLDLGVE